MFSPHRGIWSRSFTLTTRDYIPYTDPPDEADYNTFGFGGSGKSVTTSYDSNSVLSTNMTASVWVYQTASSIDEGIFGQWQTSHGWMLYNTGSSGYRFYIGGNYISTSVTLNQWNHLVGTYEGTTMRLYINGVEKVSALETSAISNNDNISLEVGRYSGLSSLNFSGSITSPMLFDRAFSASEVSNLYQGGKTAYYETLPTSMTDDALWAIEMSSRDNSLTDLSGNGNDGTAVGGATSDGELQTFTSYS